VQQERSSSIPWVILGSALLLGFSSATRNMCIPPMEYIIREELLLTHTETSLLYSIPIIMMATLSIPAGIIADRIGFRKATGIGAILMALGTVLRGTATDFSLLLAFTFILGAGGAFLLPNLSKLVSLWVTREKIGMAMGLYFSVITAGGALTLAITLPVIFPITNTIQGTFMILSIPTVVAAIVWWVLVRDPPSSSNYSSMVKESNIPLSQVLRNKNLWLIAIFFFITSFFFHNWLAWAPALMMERGATPDIAALMGSIVMWVSIPSAFLAPRLSYKLGVRKPFLWIPSIILTLAPLWAIYITVPMGWPLMTMVGILDSTRTITVLALPVELMPKEAVGRASGLIVSVGFSGGVVGPLVGGRILDLTGSIDLSLLVLIGISVAAIAIALKIPEPGLKAS